MGPYWLLQATQPPRGFFTDRYKARCWGFGESISSTNGNSSSTENNEKRETKQEQAVIPTQLLDVSAHTHPCFVFIDSGKYPSHFLYCAGNTRSETASRPSVLLNMTRQETRVGLKWPRNSRGFVLFMLSVFFFTPSLHHFTKKSECQSSMCNRFEYGFDTHCYMPNSRPPVPSVPTV